MFYVKDKTMTKWTTTSMKANPIIQNRRILLIDDNESVLNDFMKILKLDDWTELDELSGQLFGDNADTGTHYIPDNKDHPESENFSFDVDSVLKGEDGYQLVVDHMKSEEPYALAFVDMRMPLGWDGLETIQNLWSIDPDLQIVICTAYSDYTWQELIKGLTYPDKILLLKKPFEPIEICQLALSLTEKWNLSRIANQKINVMEDLVQQKTKEVVMANEHKTRFLNMLGHEFLTPLNGVLGFAQIIKAKYGESLEDQILKYVEFIEISGEKLNSLITDLLDVVNSGSGKLSVDPHPVSPSAVIDYALKNFAHQSESHLIHVDLKTRSEMVYADIKRCNQILLNLLTNAEKHSPEKSPIQITVSTEDDDNSVRIEVRDQGPGISEEKLDKIYTLFHNIEDFKRTSTEGFGLGLALAKQLVELQGGIMSIESTINKGTNVWFTLPLASANH